MTAHTLGWQESVIVFTQNLSPYYFLATTITLLALMASVFYTTYARRQIKEQIKLTSEQCSDDSNSSETLAKNAETLQSRIKTARHQAIVNQLSATMTPEQLQEEREVEKMQLAAILSLLKEEKDKFQVSNMAELEDQLSLYR